MFCYGVARWFQELPNVQLPFFLIRPASQAQLVNNQTCTKWSETEEKEKTFSPATPSLATNRKQKFRRAYPCVYNFGKTVKEENDPFQNFHKNKNIHLGLVCIISLSPL